MRLIWGTHLTFVGLYGLVAWDAADRAREGGPFFTSVWFYVLFGVIPALLVVPLPPRLRLGPDARALLAWSLAEGPALTGVISWLSGGTLGPLAVGLAATIGLLVATRPEAPNRPTS